MNKDLQQGLKQVNHLFILEAVLDHHTLST